MLINIERLVTLDNQVCQNPSFEILLTEWVFSWSSHTSCSFWCLTNLLPDCIECSPKIIWVFCLSPELPLSWPVSNKTSLAATWVEFMAFLMLALCWETLFWIPPSFIHCCCCFPTANESLSCWIHPLSPHCSAPSLATCNSFQSQDHTFHMMILNDSISYHCHKN